MRETRSGRACRRWSTDFTDRWSYRRRYRSLTTKFATLSIAAVLLPQLSAEAAQDDIPTALRWLKRDDISLTEMFTVRAEPIIEPENETEAYLLSLGRIAFHYPGTLGGLAAREGMSCNTCHVNGGTSPHFFIKGLSSKPGTFDATNSVFSKETEDLIDNPLVIPTLYNVGKTAPYAQGGRFATLEAMLDHVVLDEFEGLDLPADVHGALVTYMQRLEDPPTPARVDWPTLEKDLAEVEEHISTLKQAIDGQASSDAVLFLFAATRHKIGRIAEFFPAQAEPRAELKDWSSKLHALRERFSTMPDDKSLHDALNQVIKPEALAPHIQGSLYNIDRMRSYLDAYE